MQLYGIAGIIVFGSQQSSDPGWKEGHSDDETREGRRVFDSKQPLVS